MAEGAVGVAKAVRSLLGLILFDENVAVFLMRKDTAITSIFVATLRLVGGIMVV